MGLPSLTDPLITSLDKLLKILGKLKSVYLSHNHLPQDFVQQDTLTFTSFYCNVIGKCHKYR